jgi:hypothetical protein
LNEIEVEFFKYLNWKRRRRCIIGESSSGLHAEREREGEGEREKAICIT